MKEIPDGSVVDMVLADPPTVQLLVSGIVIPFEPDVGSITKIIKPNGAIVLTASQPFTSYCYEQPGTRSNMPFGIRIQGIAFC